ncbi:hypothetical protein [Arthrobacter flavus]|uniref:GH26 domain-containing protein n=1 Tax=Arthrobacter flavus TaxID=95172 RepID=A0ABW4Q8T1_9MICC
MRHPGPLVMLGLILSVLVTSCSAPPKPSAGCDVFFGVAPNPHGGENWDTALTSFEQRVGRSVDIVHYYKRGQDALFPTESELNRQDEPGNERILFFNWKPDSLTWREVADGAADPYLAELGDHLRREAGQPFFLSLNAEMEDEVDENEESGQTAADFRDFFRHTVEVLSRSNPDTIVTVMNYTGTQKWAEKPWFEELYPGDDVVDWIAQDPYAFDLATTPDLFQLANQTSGGSWPGFYQWAAAHYPDKPQMLAEWGVDEKPRGPHSKASFFNSAEEKLSRLPKLRALVYWDHPGVTAEGVELGVGNTGIRSSPEALSAFRDFVNSPALTSERNCQLTPSLSR